MIFFLTQKRILKNCAGVGMGFGLMFFGLELMGYGTQVFKSSPMLIEMITDLGRNPLLAVALTALFTGFIHSSAAVIGLAMSLAQADLISLQDSMYWVYGANIGTTSTALMAAIGSNYIGRQVAWAHFFYKVGSVVVFYFFTDYFVQSIAGFGNSNSRDVANAHTIFNFVSAILFFPFINMGADKIQKLIKKQASEEDFSTKYLKTNTYNSPTLGLAHAQREILRMGDIVLSMVRDSLELFKGDNPDLQDSIRERDNQVDLLNREIKLYLVNFQNSANGLGKNVLRMIELCTDLEAAADVIDGGVLELARKKQALKLEFSNQGWSELCDFHSTVVEIVTMSLSAAHLQDAGLAKQAIAKKRELRIKERELRESHLSRLNQGLRESINTSSIHLDLLTDYRQIVSQIVNHAYSVAQQSAETQV
jgi:phosphate:Na+ symporter